MSADVPIRPAATLLLVRDDPAFQVLMVKRHQQIDFASGALVFPGGKSHPGDHDPAWAEHCVHWEETAEEERPLRIAALREGFEEAGVLPAVDAQGAPWCGDAEADALRGAVDRLEVPFLEVVRRFGLKLDLGALVPFARWVTPPIMPKRFDTWFYVAAAPADQLAVCDGRETVDAEWIAPGEAIRLGEMGERTVIFPTRMNLLRLAESGSVQDAVAAARGRPAFKTTPAVKQTPDGPMLTLPAEAGYGEVAVPLSSVA